MNKYFGKNLKADLPASLVVFLVALPLCLGIAVASGAPPISGLIAGMIGGIVVGSLSGSHISVSGPAAGLTVIVLDAQQTLGAFEIFLAAVVTAGVIQLILGILRAGIIGYYFPNSVIKGMLAAIGLILILKQIPHALGYDKETMGSDAFMLADKHNTFTEIWYAIQYNSPGAIAIVIIAMAILIAYEQPKIKNHKIFGLVPGALLAVLAGLLINQAYGLFKADWMLDGEHLVSIPVAENTSELLNLLSFPDFSLIGTQVFWVTAVTLAVVGSVETLLSIEAADKLDPHKRLTPASRELRAQGVGNTLSGLIGGLPITAVIVRSTANATAGAQTKMSAIFHGILLVVLVLSIPNILNLIPLSCLAAVLFMVGYKLAKPAIFKNMYQQGWDQFLPFVITITAILFTDLLKGIAIGLVVGLIFVIKTNFQAAVRVTEHRGNFLIRLQKDVSFLNKALVIRKLRDIPEGASVIINAERSQFIDSDIREVINNFIASAHEKNITIIREGLDTEPGNTTNKSKIYESVREVTPSK
jgi:MFS superfamily sulfate permease-like transporter